MFNKSPESTAEMGVGPSLWASGSQLWIGTRPTFVPYPTIRNTKASDRIVGSSLLLTSFRFVQSRASPPAPSTFSAAKYRSTVPKSASAMPTPQRIKYFHAASMADGVR